MIRLLQRIISSIYDSQRNSDITNQSQWSLRPLLPSPPQLFISNQPHQPSPSSLPPPCKTTPAVPHYLLWCPTAPPAPHQYQIVRERSDYLRSSLLLWLLELLTWDKIFLLHTEGNIFMITAHHPPVNLTAYNSKHPVIVPAIFASILNFYLLQQCDSFDLRNPNMVARMWTSVQIYCCNMQASSWPVLSHWILHNCARVNGSDEKCLKEPRLWFPATILILTESGLN